MFYIIAGFSIHIKKPVFEADAMDARKYIDFLRKKQTSGRLKEGVCACIYSQLCRFYEYACAMGYMEESPFSGFSSIFQFPRSLSSATLPSLLQNKAGRSYAVRSLQNALARQQADSGINICYAEL